MTEASFLRRFLRSIKERVSWCLKRPSVCCQNPRLALSYLVFFSFVLYFAWTVLTTASTVKVASKRVATISRINATDVIHPAPNNKPSEPKLRHLLRIPRNYTPPVPSFEPLLTKATKVDETLIQDPSTGSEILLKSVSTTARRRIPVPQFPPQFKERSPYRVYKNYLGPNLKTKAAIQTEDDERVTTFVTHATPNYLKNLVDLSRRWSGPISVAVYAPGEDFALAVELIVFFRACFPGIRTRASFHLFFDADLAPDYFPHHLNWVNASADCGDYEKHSISREVPLSYPVNVARNVARASARTRRVLVADVELMPSSNFVTKFAEFYEKYEANGIGTIMRKVYVLPVFEVAPGREIPGEKKDLLAMIKARRAFYFHSFICPHCQRFPGLTEWISASVGEDEDIKVFSVAKREGIFQRWEPIYVGTKKDPFFDERLTWDGLQDKMSQALEMCLMGYKFLVLDTGFLVHRPGVRTVSYTSNDPTVKWRHPLIVYNRNATKIISQELKSKYPGAFKRGMCLSET